MTKETRATFKYGDSLLGSIYRTIEELKDKALARKMRVETDQLEEEWLACKRTAHLNNY